MAALFLAGITGAVESLGNAAARPDILDRIEELLGDKYPYVRFAAARVVSVFRIAAVRPGILDRIAEMLRDENRDVRSAAAMVIKQLSYQGVRIFRSHKGFRIFKSQ